MRRLHLESRIFTQDCSRLSMKPTMRVWWEQQQKRCGQRKYQTIRHMRSRQRRVFLRIWRICILFHSMHLTMMLHWQRKSSRRLKMQQQNSVKIIRMMWRKWYQEMRRKWLKFSNWWQFRIRWKRQWKLVWMRMYQMKMQHRRVCNISYSHIQQQMIRENPRHYQMMRKKLWRRPHRHLMIG